jgi:hypothetical protein
MTEIQESKWVLRVPFIAEPGFTLDAEREATFAGINAKFRAASFGYTDLIIEGLDSDQAARKLFEDVRRGLFAASLTIDWGLRVRDEILTISGSTPLPNQVEIPMIHRDTQNLRRLVTKVTVTGKQIDKVWPTFIDSINIGITSESAAQALTYDRVKLAFELHADSYFEQSEAARFIGLIGIFEVLKDRNPVSVSAQQMIRKWKDEVSSLEDAEAASLTGSLNYLTRISIARGIGSVVDRHLGPDAAKEATALYRMRSELVHDGKYPDDFADVVRRTKQIVKDLLGHIIMTGVV